MNDSISRPFQPFFNFSASIAHYRNGFAILLLTASMYLFDLDSDYFILSYVLVFAGETLRLWAAGYLHKGKISTGGPFGFVRNPTYWGSVLIAIGLCAIAGSAWIWLLALVYFTVVYLPSIQYEEAILRKKFPVEFEAYSARVPAFYPTLRRFHDPGISYSRKQIFRNKEHVAILAILLLYAYVILIAIRVVVP